MLTTLEVSYVIIDVKETGKRIVRARELKGWSSRRLSINAHVDLGHLGKLEDGKADNVTVEFINKLATALEINAIELIEEKSIDDMAKPKTDTDYLVDLAETFKKLNIKEFSYLGGIAKFDVRGSVPAGTACVTEAQDNEYLIIEKHNLTGLPHLDNLYALRIHGESLAGDGIHDGYHVLIEPCSEISVNNKIYVCEVYGECVIKRVERTPEGKYLLKSSNDEYKTYEPSELAIKGRAVYYQPTGGSL